MLLLFVTALLLLFSGQQAENQSWPVLLRICTEAHMHTHHITPSREYVNSVRVRHLPVQMRRITQPVERLPLQK